MTIEAIEPILDLQDCLAKTYIDSEGGQKLLSPERRFDGIIFSTPELFY